MNSLLILIAKNGDCYACGPRCYNATGSLGDCVCLGFNRGLGRVRARANTIKHWKDWAIEWQRRHPTIEIVTVDLLGLENLKRHGAY